MRGISARTYYENKPIKYVHEMKIEYGSSENQPFGVVRIEYAERLFLYDYVRNRVWCCTQDFIQKSLLKEKLRHDNITVLTDIIIIIYGYT